MFPPETKHHLWKSAALKREKPQQPDWSHFNEWLKLFQMRPIWDWQLNLFRNSTLLKFMLVFWWEQFYFLDGITKARYVSMCAKLQNCKIGNLYGIFLLVNFNDWQYFPAICIFNSIVTSDVWQLGAQGLHSQFQAQQQI